MLPDNTISTTPDPSNFLAPRNVGYQPLVNYSIGGIGLQNPSAGLRYQVWRGRYIGSDIVLDAPAVSPSTLITVAGVTEFQFTFDQNMQPFVTYVVAGEVFYRWYDSTVPGFVTSSLAAGSISPRCALDDSRNIAGTLAGKSDILLTYIRDGSLFARVQRDRFLTEYELETGLTGLQIYQVGMNEKLRFQWMLFDPN